MDESFISTSDTKSSVDKTKSEKSLFDHLCPLLILRLLPQRVFDDIDSSTVYGKFPKGDSVNGMYAYAFDFLFLIREVWMFITRSFDPYCQFRFNAIAIFG